MPEFFHSNEAYVKCALYFLSWRKYKCY